MQRAFVALAIASAVPVLVRLRGGVTVLAALKSLDWPLMTGCRRTWMCFGTISLVCFVFYFALVVLCQEFVASWKHQVQLENRLNFRLFFSGGDGGGVHINCFKLLNVKTYLKDRGQLVVAP